MLLIEPAMRVGKVTRAERVTSSVALCSTFLPPLPLFFLCFLPVFSVANVKSLQQFINGHGWCWCMFHSLKNPTYPSSSPFSFHFRLTLIFWPGHVFCTPVASLCSLTPEPEQGTNAVMTKGLPQRLLFSSAPDRPSSSSLYVVTTPSVHFSKDGTCVYIQGDMWKLSRVCLWTWTTN